jgi:hypothetical protein
MLTNYLCNPTGKDAKINWDKGVDIIVKADDKLSLSVAQMDDFRPGKPGSEEALKQLEYNGLFLLDGDKSYEEQALKALAACHRAKKEQLDSFVNRLRDNRIASGSPINDEAMQELKRVAGYLTFEEDVNSVKRRLEALRKIVNSKGTVGKVKETLDPKKTCFITTPPREFPSETALELFLLDQDPDFVAQHKAMQSQMLEQDVA